MAYYIWHDDGCCANREDTLREAKEVRKALISEGKGGVYIADADNEVVVPPNCEFCEAAATAHMPQSPDQGKHVTMVYCCDNHAADWWSGADWDGSNLERHFNREN